MRTADKLLQRIELLLLPLRNCLRSCHLFLLSQYLLLLLRRERLRSRELLLLLLNLRLLLFESIDEHDAETVVAHAFDLAFVIAEGKERRNLLDLFRAEADVFRAVLLPGERDRAQAIDDVHAAGERGDVLLVAQA